MQRLRHGEWIAALSALALFAVLFLDWFASASGWSSLGWAALALCVLAIAAGLANLLVNATNESPVLPEIAAISTTVLGFLAVVALLIQVIAQPGPDELVAVKVGWWLGLLAALGITAGGWESMRVERTPNARERPIDVRPAPPVA